jgi:mitochondrial fission protein ELM1
MRTIDGAISPAGTRGGERGDGGVAVVAHGLAGDFNNALAIAEVLAEHHGSSVVVLDARLRSNLLVPVLNRLLARRRDRGPVRSEAAKRWLWRLFFVSSGPPGRDLRAAVSTLGRGEAASAFLSVMHGVPSVHLGSPKRMRRTFFSAVVAHQGAAPEDGDIGLPISPTRVSRRDTAGLGEALRSRLGVPDRLFALLFGGDAPGCRYDAAAMRRLTDAMGTVAGRLRIRWLVTTSPRTSPAQREALLGFSRPEAVAYAKAHDAADAVGLPALIAAADLVFVTCESVSMISDAVACGKPVYALVDGTIPKQPRIAAFLEAQVRAGRVKLLDVGALAALAPDPEGFVPLGRCWSADLLEALKGTGVLGARTGRPDGSVEASEGP